MTATMTRPTLESTIEGLVRLYWSNQGGNLPASKAEVATTYWMRAIRESLAAILFQHRADALPRFHTIPLIYESDINAILRKHEKLFVNGTPAEKNLEIDAIYAELIEFAVPQELIETDEAERKRRVLDGEEPALPTDEGWITEMAEEKRREVEEIIALLRPVTKAPDDALLRCTRDDCAHLPEHRRSLHEYTVRTAAAARESEAQPSKGDEGGMVSRVISH